MGFATLLSEALRATASREQFYSLDRARVRNAVGHRKLHGELSIAVEAHDAEGFGGGVCLQRS